MNNMYFVEPGSKGLLSPLRRWMNNGNVSEILINRPKEVWVEENGEMERHHINALDAVYLRRLFQSIANENQAIIDESHPFISGSLHDGSRVQLVIPPVATHPTLSIRKRTYSPLTLKDYQTQNFFRKTKAVSRQTDGDKCDDNLDEVRLDCLYRNQEWLDFIHKAIQMKKNIIISGGTNSGKTTFLNTCLSYIPHAERLITFEDVREVLVPHQNQVNLLTSEENKISMQDLIKISLRLRPDRLIIGEIRGKEVLDFISACMTGHSGSIATIHASSPMMALQRMIQLYKYNNVPSMKDAEIRDEIQSIVDIIIQLKKTANGREATQVWYNDY